MMPELQILESDHANPFALTEQYRARQSGDESGVPTSKEQFVPDLNVRLMCTDCQSDPPNLIEESISGDLECGDCGLVIGDRIIDVGSEWRTFLDQDGDDPSRVGHPLDPLLNGLGEQLRTDVSDRGQTTGSARELRRAIERAVGPSDRLLLDGFEEIQRMCDRIHLPRAVSDTAKHMFRRVERDQILRGSHKEGVIAAVIFCACRTNRVPRTFPEICQLTNVDQKVIVRCFQEMKAAYGLNLPRAGDPDQASFSAQAKDLVPRFCNHLGLDAHITRCSEDVASILCEKHILTGKNPITIAATCILVVTRMLGNDLTAKQISSVVGISDATIKGTSKTLAALHHDWLTSDVITRYPELDVARLPEIRPQNPVGRPRSL